MNEAMYKHVCIRYFRYLSRSYHEALSVFSSIPRCSIPLNLSVRGKGTLAVYKEAGVCVGGGGVGRGVGGERTLVGT